MQAIFFILLSDSKEKVQDMNTVHIRTGFKMCTFRAAVHFKRIKDLLQSEDDHWSTILLRH